MLTIYVLSREVGNDVWEYVSAHLDLSEAISLASNKDHNYIVEYYDVDETSYARLFRNNEQ